ncbi:MAG: twin-arginine translocase TatA/TatE family subunit [Alcanivorax sp.]
MAPSAVQILIIVLIVMILFGAGRIPNIMENLAKGVTSFKKGLKDEDENQKAIERAKQDEKASDAVIEVKDESKEP